MQSHRATALFYALLSCLSSGHGIIVMLAGKNIIKNIFCACYCVANDVLCSCNYVLDKAVALNVSGTGSVTGIFCPVAGTVFSDSTSVAVLRIVIT